MKPGYSDKMPDVLTKHHVISLISRLLHKIKNILFFTHYSIWFVRDLNDTIDTLTEFKEYTIEFDALEEIISWIILNNKQYPWMYSEKEICIARTYGHIIPFVKYNERIIGYTKVALNKVYIRDYDAVFTLAPNKAMFYDTTFLPEFRGKKLPRYLKNEIYTFLKNINIQQIYAHIESWNTPSILSNKGVGFKELCRNRYVRILCFKYHAYNPNKFLSTSALSYPQ